MEVFRVGISPHIRHEDSVRSIMLDVCIALIPALLWGIYVFGLRALVITLLSILSCVGFEALFQLLLKKRVTVSDLSAVVSGLLLAMNLPVAVPLWIVPLGAAFAMIVVKNLFGGIGKNFVNPVLCARAFLFVSFPLYMSRYTEPFSALSPWKIKLSEGALADAVTSATPLDDMKNGIISAASFSDLFTGNTAGCIGEGSALLLLAGLLYLLVRHIITWHIPVSYLATVAVVSFLFPQAGGHFDFMLSSLLSGGLILGAVFMATDPVTSPVTTGGKVVFGILCGLLTVLIRFFGGYTEGVSFAILMANLLVWYLDRLFRPRPYGTRRFHKKEGKA